MKNKLLVLMAVLLTVTLSTEAFALGGRSSSPSRSIGVSKSSGGFKSVSPSKSKSFDWSFDRKSVSPASTPTAKAPVVPTTQSTPTIKNVVKAGVVGTGLIVANNAMATPAPSKNVVRTDTPKTSLGGTIGSTGVAAKQQLTQFANNSTAAKLTQGQPTPIAQPQPLVTTQPRTVITPVLVVPTHQQPVVTYVHPTPVYQPQVVYHGDSSLIAKIFMWTVLGIVVLVIVAYVIDAVKKNRF